MAEFIPRENVNLVAPPLHVEEKAPTWVEQYGAAFVSLVLGIFLLIGSFALLSWNEYKTVDEIWRLNEGTRLVVSLASDKPDSDTNGQLVHVSGKISTNEMLSDEMFFITTKAVKLQRVVEMFQWSEEFPKKMDDDKEKLSLTYNKIWSQRAIDSSRFRQQQAHVNPPMEFSSAEYSANNVNLGEFGLSERFVLELKEFHDLPMTEETFAQINPELVGFKLHDGGFFKGANAEVPEVGDIRVRFRVVEPGNTVSVIGMQNLDKIQTYHTDYTAFNLLAEGVVDADTMFRREVNARDVGLIWQLRFGAWVTMLISMIMILYSFNILAPVLPGVAGLVGYNNYEMAIFLSLACSLVTVASAWLPYRSGFALGLMVLGFSLLIVASFLKKKEAKKKKVKKVKAAKKIKEKTQKEPKEIPAKVRFLKAPRKE